MSLLRLVIRVLWTKDYDGEDSFSPLAILITTYFPLFQFPKFPVFCEHPLTIFGSNNSPQVRVQNKWITEGDHLKNLSWAWTLPVRANSLLSHSSLICTCLIYFQTLSRPCIFFHVYFHISGMKDFCLTLRTYGQQSKDSKDGMQDPHGWITGENQ